MSKIKVVARLKIYEGKFDEFRALAAECRRIEQEKDQGTLQYDWFLMKIKMNVWCWNGIKTQMP
jgi:quinol monooxygenase YgiN